MAKYLEQDVPASSASTEYIDSIIADEVARSQTPAYLRPVTTGAEANVPQAVQDILTGITAAAGAQGPGIGVNDSVWSDANLRAAVAAATPVDVTTINAGINASDLAIEGARESGVFYGSQNTGVTPAVTAKYPALTKAPLPGTKGVEPPALTANPAFDAILAVLSSYGMSGVADKISEIRALYPDISSADLMTLLKYDKRFNAPYLDRFSGNAALMAKGFAPLDEKTYLANEQAYSKIFNAYGIADQFANKEYYAKLIGGSVSPDEANSRVSMAFDRVLNDKMTLGAFNKFYPTIKTSAIAATLLDPEQQLPALQRQVTSAEIGGQALMQGLQASLLADQQKSMAYSNVTTGTLGAEELAKMGVTKATAGAAYSKIGEVLPTAEKLSSIYGSTLDQYGQVQAEQEQLMGMASAKRKREQLAATEVGTFSAQSGASKGAFSTNYLNKTSSAGLI